MNFFEAQDDARRKTWQLGLMFAAAVITLVVLTNVLFYFAMNWSSQYLSTAQGQTTTIAPDGSWIWITVGVVGVVGVASLYKYLSLRGGGRTIAQALGGTLIPQSTTNPQQRQLLNVVEEMAIAAGVPVPPVYLIPEASINAFAAGFSVDDAVIGINQGTLDLLNRSELQGVVGHEFSHILNGDMRINLRLIAILHGILFIGMIGYGLLRFGGASRKNGAPLLALGLGLAAVGYGGTFFGNLIKAAVSRQREFLADASAVQFTRDPGGIANALKKIGGHVQGSHMQNAAAEEVSHMFFGAAARKFSANLFATHPPLPKRIHAIEPGWDGRFPNVTPSTGSPPTSFSNPSGLHSQFAGSVQPQAVNDRVGQPSAASVDKARELIAENDAALIDAAHDPYEARALVYAMLIDPDAQIAQQQLDFLDQRAERGVPIHVHRLLPLVREHDPLHLLTLFEMAVPALKELSSNQYEVFIANAAHVITLDKRIDIFEWVLHRLLVKALHAHFRGPQPTHGNIGRIGKLQNEAAALLAVLASHGHDTPAEQLAAYSNGMAELGLSVDFASHAAFDYRVMNDALSQLRRLRPLTKPGLVKACVATVTYDDHVNAAEAALLQGIAATLDCPLPPDILDATTS